MLTPYNFEPGVNGRDTESIASMALVENGGELNGEANNPMYRNTMAMYTAPVERESQPPLANANMARSYSMPNVPVPPPMPPPSDSQPPTPSGTLKRNMAAAGALAGGNNTINYFIVLFRSSKNLDKLIYRLFLCHIFRAFQIPFIIDFNYRSANHLSIKLANK